MSIDAEGAHPTNPPATAFIRSYALSSLSKKSLSQHIPHIEYAHTSACLKYCSVPPSDSISTGSVVALRLSLPQRGGEWLRCFLPHPRCCAPSPGGKQRKGWGGEGGSTYRTYIFLRAVPPLLLSPSPHHYLSLMVTCSLCSREQISTRLMKRTCSLLEMACV